MKGTYNNNDNFEEDSNSLKEQKSDHNLNSKLINTEASINLELPNTSISDTEILNCIEAIKESLANEFLTVSNCSELIQTNIHNNSSSKMSSKEFLPSMNCFPTFIIKNSLQETENNNLQLNEYNTNLNINEFITSNSFHSNNNNNLDNIESYRLSTPCSVESNNIEHVPNIKHYEQENNLNTHISSLTVGTINSELNNENNCIEKINLVNNYNLCTDSNVITNVDMKQVLNKLNGEFDFLTKNNGCNGSITNDLFSASENLKLCENNSASRSSLCVSIFQIKKF